MCLCTGPADTSVLANPQTGPSLSEHCSPSQVRALTLTSSLPAFLGIWARLSPAKEAEDTQYDKLGKGTPLVTLTSLFCALPCSRLVLKAEVAPPQLS